jgi:hypothetical protein
MADPLVAAFLVAHGLVHLAIYAIPPDPTKPAPFDPSRSWVLASRGVAVDAMRTASIALAGITAAAYTIAGVALVIDAPWGGVAALAATAGVTLKTLWFHPWLIVGVAIDLAVLVALTGGL